MKKSIILVFVVSMLFVSCDMFTTPLWEGRDLSETFSKATTDEIVDLLNSGQALSGEDSKGITNALAEKDPEELNGLSTEDKSTIVNVAASGILPPPDEILSVLDVENLESMTEEDITKLITDAIDSIDETVNTGGLESLFGNDDTVKELLKESPDALVLGTLALTASIAKESDVLAAAAEDPAILETLFEETITKMKDSYGDEEITAEEADVLADILASDLNADAEKVAPLVNVIVAVYEASEEPGGLESLGALESLFTGFLGLDSSSVTP